MKVSKVLLTVAVVAGLTGSVYGADQTTQVNAQTKAIGIASQVLAEADSSALHMSNGASVEEAPAQLATQDWGKQTYRLNQKAISLRLPARYISNTSQMNSSADEKGTSFAMIMSRGVLYGEGAVKITVHLNAPPADFAKEQIPYMISTTQDTVGQQQFLDSLPEQFGFAKLKDGAEKLTYYYGEHDKSRVAVLATKAGTVSDSSGKQIELIPQGIAQTVLDGVSVRVQVRPLSARELGRGEDDTIKMTPDMPDLAQLAYTVLREVTVHDGASV